MNEDVILKENLGPIINVQINSDIIDVVFVPLLAYDSKNRVGYGKGFYIRPDSKLLKLVCLFFLQNYLLQILMKKI